MGGSASHPFFMHVPKQFKRDLALIRSGLSVAWNRHLGRYQIFYTDHRTGSKRLVMTVEDAEGNFQSLDMRVIIRLQRDVVWEMVDKYPTPEDLADFFLQMQREEKTKPQILRREFMKWWNKDHRSDWKKLFEEFRSGRFGINSINEIFSPPKHEPKLIII